MEIFLYVEAKRLFQLLLGAKLVGVTTFLLTAVGSPGRQTSLSRKRLVGCGGGDEEGTYVALAANHLLTVVLGGKGLQGRLNDTSTETEDQVEGRLLNSSKYPISNRHPITPFTQCPPIHNSHNII